MLPSSILINALRTNIYSLCIRNLRKNPGVNKRVKMLSSPGDNLEEANAEDLDQDELESDFMGVHQTHKEHVQQLKEMKEQEKFYMIRQKYFKEIYPNFLTWHDKEQIRYLHRKDPEEWSVERLSEGFPALPDVIVKIVKSSWRKTNQKRIFNHDRHVEENWNMFKEGKLHHLPKELKDHLTKFTKRNLVFTPHKVSEEVEENIVKIKPKLPYTEFSDIISDYEMLRLKRTNESSKVVESCTKDSTTGKDEAKHNTFEKKNYKGAKHIDDHLTTNNESDTYYEKPPLKDSSSCLTLTSLRMKIERKVNTGKSMSAQDQLILSQLNHVKQEPTPESKAIELKPENLKTNVPTKFNKPENNYLQLKHPDYSHLMYPKRITIPAKLRKRGHTYKLNDCYYDYDGSFLYRVPGMVQ